MSRLWCILIVFSLFSCHSDPNVLDAEEQYMIDTLLGRQIQQGLKIEMDSVCDLKYDTYLEAAKDSIMERRLEEIRHLSRE